jgi:hypothetical protein
MRLAAHRKCTSLTFSTGTIPSTNGLTRDHSITHAISKPCEMRGREVISQTKNRVLSAGRMGADP